MSAPLLQLLAERDDGGAVDLRAPAVGVWSGAPPDGSLLGPGSPAGTLRQGRARFRLVVPAGVAGRVVAPARRDREVPVGYDEILFRIAPLREAEAASAGRVAGVETPSALHLVAPTDGVVYLAPSPGAAPFVAEGARVRAGQTVGLIEVMKTFNPIAYGGDGLPDEAVVVGVLAADGEEVRAGSPLLAVEPA